MHMVVEERREHVEIYPVPSEMCINLLFVFPTLSTHRVQPRDLLLYTALANQLTWGNEYILITI